MDPQHSFYHIYVEIWSAMHRNYHALLLDELVKKILRIEISEYILYLLPQVLEPGDLLQLHGPSQTTEPSGTSLSQKAQTVVFVSFNAVLNAFYIDFCDLTCSFSSLINFNWFLNILRLLSYTLMVRIEGEPRTPIFLGFP